MSATAAPFQNWLNAGLGFFYPETCQICGEERANAREGYVCRHCWTQVRFIREPFCKRCGLPYPGDLTTPFECANCRGMQLHFSSARSAVVARGIVLDIIHRYKYQRALWFEPFLADLIVREAKPVLKQQRWDFIVPVPLHSVKFREREFNQAGRLARHLSVAAGIPLNNKLLKRVMPTATQTLLTREQRAANMRNAFLTAKRVRLRGSRIVLVDDVFTTGATTSACAKVLRAAGAEDVCVWTVARGL
ncbi:MAG TPA: ComF family protein [Verrucomicrobiae bacterium]|nr:ComF family protein [Verrucomicrobiae bacterium]